jgi:hypothetical protein
VTDEEEKRSRYLSLFGLDPLFTKDELTRAYRTLAKLNHPDISADPAAQMRMVIINAGYEFLADAEGTVPVPVPSQSSRIDDPAYSLYRRGFELLEQGFDLYYTEGAPARSEKMSHFYEMLREAKAELARVIREYPESRWTGDAIDKVMNINLWLKD